MAQTPLHVSAGYNNIEIVKHLLDWRGAEKVELEAKNMVNQKYFNQHCFFYFLQEVTHSLLTHIVHLHLINWEVWRNSIAHGSKEWV